jgi:hypothetical protein
MIYEAHKLYSVCEKKADKNVDGTAMFSLTLVGFRQACVKKSEPAYNVTNVWRSSHKQCIQRIQVKLRGVFV